MTRNLGASVRSGVRISVIATILTGLIQVGSMTVLARLLVPADYGFFVTAVAVNGVTLAVLVSVFERAFVFRDGGDGRLLGAYLLLIGAVALGVAAACALIRAVTGWRIDLGVLAVVLAAGVAGAIATTRRAWLRRELHFGGMAAADLGGLLLGNVLTAVLLAWMGWGAYALATGNLVAQIVASGVIVLRGPRRAEAGVDTVRAVIPTAGRLLRVAGLEALNGQVAPLMVSATLNATLLGLFNRVYTVVTLPVQMLVSSLYRVVISAFVSVADDPARRVRAMEKMLRMSGAVITPLALGLAASGPAFVGTLLGPRWTEAVPIVPYLAVAVWGNMLGTLLGQVPEAMQRFEAKAWVQAISTACLVALLGAGSLGGLIGVAIGTMAGALLFVGLSMRMAAAVVGVPVRAMLGWLAPGIAAGVSAAAAALCAGRLIGPVAAPLLLAVQIGACGLATLASYLVFDRPFLADMAGMTLPAAVAGRTRRLLVPHG